MKPVGTKAKVYQILPAFGGHVFVELTAIDTADLENIEDEDEFWVGDCGQSGPFELEIVHQDLRSCYVDKAGSVFAFEFSIARDTDLDSGSTHPAGGTSASFAGATATVEHLNDLTGTTNIGARANAGYQLSVVSDSFTGAGLTVRARALTRLTSSGSLMIRNYPLGLPSFNIGLSYSWGLVSLSVGSSIGWPKRGSSAGGAGIQLDINGSISGQPQDSRSCLDVMYTDTVTVEKTFSLSLGVDFADAHRLYTAGVTEYPVQTRTDVLSSVKTGTYGVDTCVPLNTHTTDAPTILGEDDNVFEIQ